MNKVLSFTVFLFTAFTFFSCDEEEVKSNADLQLNFSHTAKSKSFAYGETYQNEAGNSFSIQLWRTYISEIELIDQEGVSVEIENSYHLIEPLAGGLDTILLKSIPNGVYTKIRFNIGIPDDENLSGTLKGDLDPSNNMAWNWVKGYKFIRVDGEFLDQQNNRRGVIVHIGTAENLKQLQFDLLSPLRINGVNKAIGFNVNINALFEQPNKINFEQLNDFQFNAETALIAENYEEGYILLADN